MSRTLLILCKAVSLAGAGLFVFFGGRLVSAEPVSSDFLKAALFAFMAISLGLNLLRLPRAGAMALIVIHGAAAFYFGYALWNMALLAFGESGSRSGLWRFFVPPLSLLIALVVSVLFNLYRLKGGTRAI